MTYEKDHDFQQTRRLYIIDYDLLPAHIQTLEQGIMIEFSEDAGTAVCHVGREKSVWACHEKCPIAPLVVPTTAADAGPVLISEVPTPPNTATMTEEEELAIVTEVPVDEESLPPSSSSDTGIGTDKVFIVREP